MDIIKMIEKKIHNTINVVDVKIIDESVKHTNHHFSSLSKLPSHIKLILISDDFIGMSALKRYRLIHKLLKNEIRQLHAISIQLYTQNELT